ncbi:two-component hybrid sensor and regulator [Labilithrix luteola]|uniref:histidine kinase n=1 Tax=Labilithrix luteola TaxID=1391654 RepID=A0A0K1PX87_9BACT|nr:GAF domain-containing hybrid sensor histidine kinase/response regulator [Labilithrix luteola]AKU98001.1 two-component hybrid sensor and regulator [Labilithrix luteola]
MRSTDTANDGLTVRAELENLLSELERIPIDAPDRRDHIRGLIDRSGRAVLVCDRTHEVCVASQRAFDVWSGRLAKADLTTPLRFEVVDARGRTCSLATWMTTHVDVGGPPEEVMIERFDRSRIRLYARCLALRDSGSATAVGYVCDFELAGSAMLEDAQAAHRRASFLAQSVPRLLAASLDPRARLRQLVKLIVPAFADACAVFVRRGDGVLQVEAGLWADAEKDTIARALNEKFPLRLGESSGVSRVFASGIAEVIPRFTEKTLRQVASSQEHYRLLRRLGFYSGMLVPLIVDNRVVAAVSLVLTDPERSYGPADLDTAEQLALNAGLALESARRYQEEQKARAESEDAAQKLARLQAIMTDLASALTVEEVGDAIVDHGIRAVGARSAVIWMVEHQTHTLRVIRMDLVARYPRSLFETIPIESDFPLAQCVRERTPIFVVSQEDFVARYPLVAPRFSEIPSFACLPLVAHDEVVGAVSFGFDAPRPFDDEQRMYLMLVAEHCAQGLVRARLYEAAQHARNEMALLFKLGEAVNRARTIGEVYDAAIDALQLVPKIGRCAIVVFPGDGEPSVAASHGLSANFQDELARAARQHRRVSKQTLVSDVDTDPSMEPYRALCLEENIRALAIFPLVHRDDVLGKFIVYSSEQHRFRNEELRIARAIAGQLAQALARRRAETEAQGARAAAEHASRMKDEFLAVVSHELRTPLASLTGWASILQTKRKNDPATLEKGIAVIARNARAQATIINDILDVSRIIRGTLHIDERQVSLAPIIAETIESLKTSATAKQIRVTFDHGQGEFSLLGDAERLRQIVWNLLSNAIKFTPAGGRVQLRLRRRAPADEAACAPIVLEVEDDGVGIDRRMLPFVFDRFSQGDSSSTRREGGLGLGLAIVRHLVELHGGHVSVESAGVGRGATFRVELPVCAAVESAANNAAQEVSEPPSAVPSIPPPSESSALRGIRVLVVDDHPDARDVLKEALVSYGATVAVAGSAREAMTILPSFTPDVLVSDIGMPEEDGYALLQRVRQLPGPLAQVPAVAVTAYARTEDAQRARRAGFYCHVPKPTKPEILADAVTRAFRAA